MTVQWSTTLRNGLLDAYETLIGVSAKVMLYNGGMPANVAAATTGTKLAEFDLASDWAGAASGGSKSFSSTPIATTALAIGTLGYYRVFASDGTTCHEQGTIALSAADMITDAVSIGAIGQNISITSWSKTAPGA